MIVNQDDRRAERSEFCGGRNGAERLPTRVVECDEIRNTIINERAKSMAGRECKAVLYARIFADNANW
jgi:hypothetical protein